MFEGEDVLDDSRVFVLRTVLTQHQHTDLSLHSESASNRNTKSVGHILNKAPSHHIIRGDILTFSFQVENLHPCGGFTVLGS